MKGAVTSPVTSPPPPPAVRTCRGDGKERENQGSNLLDLLNLARRTADFLWFAF